jgi:hypothetical protein
MFFPIHYSDKFHYVDSGGIILTMGGILTEDRSDQYWIFDTAVFIAKRHFPESIGEISRKIRSFPFSFRVWRSSEMSL